MRIMHTRPDDGLDEALARRLGERIRELRQSKKLSQEQAAEAMGIDQSAWSRIEHARTGVSVTQLLRI